MAADVRRLRGLTEPTHTAGGMRTWGLKADQTKRLLADVVLDKANLLEAASGNNRARAGGAVLWITRLARPPSDTADREPMICAATPRSE